MRALADPRHMPKQALRDVSLTDGKLDDRSPPVFDRLLLLDRNLLTPDHSQPGVLVATGLRRRPRGPWPCLWGSSLGGTRVSSPGPVQGPKLRTKG